VGGLAIFLVGTRCLVGECVIRLVGGDNAGIDGVVPTGGNVVGANVGGVGVREGGGPFKTPTLVRYKGPERYLHWPPSCSGFRNMSLLNAHRNFERTLTMPRGRYA